MTKTHILDRFGKRGSWYPFLALGACSVGCLLQPQVALAGPKGIVHVRYLGVPPVMDARLNDWPLDQYTTIAQHPEFPEVRDSESSFANGDQLVFSLDRVGRFNQTSFLAWTEGEHYSDFGSTVYFGYDFNFLYVLAVTIDDVEQADRDTTDFGSSGGLNDGFGLLFDARGDSAQCVASQDFPRFDTTAPHVDDFQLTVALNSRFKPADAQDHELGARQVVERSGFPGLMAVEGGDRGVYQKALDRARADDGQADIVARHYDDLRRAGALNPEIIDDVTRIFSGYVIEMRIPFSTGIDFTPDHDMGFEFFWRDADRADDPGHGVDDVSWGAWAQSSEFDCSIPQYSILNAANWATLAFDEPEKPRLRRLGQNLVLSWPGTGTLQQTTSLAGGGQWEAIPNASSPFVITPATTYRFYRVIR